MSRVPCLSALLLCFAASAAVAEPSQLPLSSEQLNLCVWEPSVTCATRTPQIEFDLLPGSARQALRSYGNLLDNSEYPDDPAEATYFLLAQQGEVQPLLSWTDSVSTKIVLVTVWRGKVADVLRVANDGPDENQADSFSMDSDQSIRLYRQAYAPENANGDRRLIGKKQLVGVYRIQADGKIVR